jgi:hypothetical protein
MPNKRIDQLNPNLNSLTGNELIPIFDLSSNTTEKITIDTLGTYIDSMNDTFINSVGFNNSTDLLTLYRNDGTNLSTTINRYNRWYVPSGQTLTIPNNFQSFIYGDFIVEGTVNLQENAQLVVLNGNIILSGGTIIGSGTTYSIDLPEFNTFVTNGIFNNTTKQINFTGNYGFTPFNVDLSPLIFTGNTISECISDIYVSNVHSCSPLHINPNDEGNVYFGSTSGVTIDVTNGVISANTINATTYYGDGSNLTNTKPYKVYTALLTQSGGNDPFSLFSGDLTIGVTYEIYDDGGYGFDFTNVGAPNNNFGTYFVATENTPNSWGTDAKLNYNTGAPVVTVLENTIGNIWFTWEGNGNYWITSNGLFTINKTWGISDSVFAPTTAITEPVVIDVSGHLGSEPPNTMVIRLIGGDFSGDDLLNKTPIEIRVYN